MSHPANDRIIDDMRDVLDEIRHIKFNVFSYLKICEQLNYKVDPMLREIADRLEKVVV